MPRKPSTIHWHAQILPIFAGAFQPMKSETEKKEEEWFRHWFDSPYYHLLYKHRDAEEASRFIANLTDHPALPSEGHLLDLACGKGRHALQLAKAGYRVTGLDLSPDSIEEARKNPHPNATFLVQDMRTSFGVEEYDAVLNLFSSFGYFGGEEDARVIRNVYDALRPGGAFVLDYMNTQKRLRDLIPEERFRLEGVSFHLKRFREDDFLVKTIDIEDGGETHHFREKLRLLREEDLITLLEEQGLQVQEKKGDYDLNPFDPMSSDRLILIARKTY